MRVIPRAFATPLEHTRDPDSDHHIRCYPDETRAVTIELPAGGALFFAYGTPHATGPNATDQERAGVALHFLQVDQAGTARAGFEPTKRARLGGPGACGGAEVYGIDLGGAWEEEIARVLATGEGGRAAQAVLRP
jgi:hypothetical protein